MLVDINELDFEYLPYSITIPAVPGNKRYAFECVFVGETEDGEDPYVETNNLSKLCSTLIDLGIREVPLHVLLSALAKDKYELSQVEIW